MKSLARALAVVALAASATQAYAHGTEPHPKCKPGYVLSDAHRCVKK